MTDADRQREWLADFAELETIERRFRRLDVVHVAVLAAAVATNVACAAVAGLPLGLVNLAVACWSAVILQRRLLFAIARRRMFAHCQRLADEL